MINYCHQYLSSIAKVAALKLLGPSLLLKFLTCAQILAVFNQFPAMAQPAATASLDGATSLRLLQGCWSSGNQEILLSPLGVKVSNAANHLVITFPKPYTEVHAYNTRSKRIYHTPFERFVSPYATSMATIKGVTFGDLQLTREKSLTYKGCNAELWSLSKEGIARQMAARAKKDLVKAAPKTFALIAATKIPLDKKVVRFLCLYYALPEAVGLPLEVQYDTLNNNHHHYLTTQKIAAATVKAAQFSLPANYSKSSVFADLVISGESDDGMKLILMDH